MKISKIDPAEKVYDEFDKETERMMQKKETIEIIQNESIEYAKNLKNLIKIIKKDCKVLTIKQIEEIVKLTYFNAYSKGHNNALKDIIKQSK